MTRQRQFDLQGHRGARGLWPENTLGGFARALEIGLSTLELDCAVTRDGVVVVSHDPRLNPAHTRDASGRFLTAPGPSIVSLSFAELQQYDVGRLQPGSEYAARLPQQEPIDGERIPRLADLFSLVDRLGFDRVRFNIETKIFPLEPALSLPPAPFTQALLEVVRRAGMQSRTMIQSFDWRTLKIVHDIAPEIDTVALTDQQPGEDTIQLDAGAPSAWLGGLDARQFGGSAPRLVAAIAARIWSPSHRDIDRALVDEAHTLGLKVIPWTVNDPLEMRRQIDMQIDGLISDRPDLLRGVLASMGLDLPSSKPVNSPRARTD